MGLEVDFVLYGPKGLLAFEIKRKSSVFKKDLKGLRAFSQDYPEAKSFLFCSVSKKEYYGDIQVLPIETALRDLRELLFC